MKNQDAQFHAGCMLSDVVSSFEMHLNSFLVLLALRIQLELQWFQPEIQWFWLQIQWFWLQFQWFWLQFQWFRIVFPDANALPSCLKASLIIVQHPVDVSVDFS